jgi:hypothetical protein
MYVIKLYVYLDKIDILFSRFYRNVSYCRGVLSKQNAVQM